METRIPSLLFHDWQVGNTLINCIYYLFEEFEYTHTKKSHHIEIFGYTEALYEENDLDEPTSIFIGVNGFGKFDSVLYEDDRGWHIHKPLTNYLKDYNL